jgi:hypothetical protein
VLGASTDHGKGQSCLLGESQSPKLPLFRERFSFDVPTLPLFVHERLSTKAIIETLTGHKRDKQMDMYGLFGDPQHSVTDQVLRALEHRDKWVNRMVLGDSLAVMNSLLHYEGLGGQVQLRPPSPRPWRRGGLQPGRRRCRPKGRGYGMGWLVWGSNA